MEKFFEQSGSYEDVLLTEDKVDEYRRGMDDSRIVYTEEKNFMTWYVVDMPDELQVDLLVEAYMNRIRGHFKDRESFKNELVEYRRSVALAFYQDQHVTELPSVN